MQKYQYGIGMKKRVNQRRVKMKQLIKEYKSVALIYVGLTIALAVFMILF